jgi:hypothetical protein
MQFFDTLKVTVDKKARLVRLSIKLSEITVITTVVRISDFQQLIAQFNTELNTSDED